MHLKPTAGCQISTLIFDLLFMEGGLYKYPMKNILRRVNKGEQAITHELLEVTSPEAALTGNDVTKSHVTGSYVITGSMFCVFPRFLSYPEVAAVYIPVSAAAAAHSPRSAALRLFSRDTTVRTRT
jgi:hypothetical protein